MEHSKNYDKVKRWYEMKMWNEARVCNAVKMLWITKEEFKEITGSSYRAAESEPLQNGAAT